MKLSLTSTNKINALFFLGILLFCFYYSFCLFYGERIPVNNGIGFDGLIYANLARSPFAELFAQTLNPYYFQRILSPLVVHGISKLLHYSLATDHHVVTLFYLLDVLLLAIGLCFFYRLTLFLNWSASLRFLCLSLLLFNFATLKMVVYYPVLTDTSAFFLGIIVLNFYLRSNQLGLLLITFIGSFVFPSMIYAMAPLIFFPRRHEKIVFRHQANRYFPLVCTLLVGAWVAYCASHPPFRLDVNLIQPWVLPFSLLAFLLFIFYATRFLIYPRLLLKDSFKQVAWQNGLIYLIIFIVTRIIITRFANDEPPVLGMLQYISWISYNVVVNPLTSIVAHLMYFGPGVVLLFLLWPKITEHCYQLGIGCVSFVSLYLFLGFGSESRQIINAWPMFVILLGYVLEQYKISWQFSVSIAFLSLILSRFWLPLNVGTWDQNYLQFPTQMCFMNFGPWMSNRMYVVFTMLGFISLITLYHMLKSIGLGHSEGIKGAVAAN